MSDRLPDGVQAPKGVTDADHYQRSCGGKVPLFSRSHAKEAQAYMRRQFPGARFVVYSCSYGKHYHVGNDRDRAPKGLQG